MLAIWVQAYGQHQLVLKSYLEGPFDTVTHLMKNDLNITGSIPINQPFNQSPWNYDGGEQVPYIPNEDVIDWVLVELRETAGNASTAYKDNTIWRQAGFILSNGSIVSVDGISSMQFSITTNYRIYAVIIHRNHLPVLSNDQLIQSEGSFCWDFTTGENQAYGGQNAHKELSPSIWGLRGGDGNANGQIDNNDKNIVWDLQAGSFGYLSGDFNLDNQVNNADKNDIWIINSGFSSQIPGIWECGYPIVDTRDGFIYSTAIIGTQCWMAENLNFGLMINGNISMSDNGVIEKYCYNNDTANCSIYGGLYQWDEMMGYTINSGIQGICPDGWHIPSDQEFIQLEAEADSHYGLPGPWGGVGWRGHDVGKNLKATIGWFATGHGTDLFHFHAIPGGYRAIDGSFSDEMTGAKLWSSNNYSSSYSWSRILKYDRDESLRNWNHKQVGFSVRCLMD